MEGSRREALKALLEQALALPPELRAAFVEHACQGDAVLRDELTSLLAYNDEAPAFFDSLAEALHLQGSVPSDQHLFDPLDLVGHRVAHYQVLKHLGGGGMGVVYQARDTRLDRTVALKFLPPHLGTSEAAKARFMHEAKVASSLDHPNLCTIYEIGENEKRLFIAMAYYAGETLKTRIERGPLQVEEALDYAVQIARGLEKAHEAGIVHRDIKPSNVMVTEDGLVKIVDFGIAKIADQQLTQTGATVGTVAYMSPEQARGEGVDQKTDVWALGVVLYESLAGERPFKGHYPEAIVYSVLHEDSTPLTVLNPDVPPDLEHVVGLCLEKNKDVRYPSMTDLLADLEVWTEEKEAPRLGPVRSGLIASVSILVTLLVLMTIPSVRQAIVKGVGISDLPDQKHLAVLSLAKVDTVDQPYTEGLVETLTRTLTRLQQTDRSIWVVPSQDLRTHGVKKPIEAQELFGVNLALTVDAVHDRDTVWVAMELVDPLTLRVWKEDQIARPVAHPAALDKELVSRLADLLEVDVHPSILRDLTDGGTTIPGAQEFYTLGLGYLQDYNDTDNIDAAIELFGRALEEDPAYALAHAGLGEAYWRKYTNSADGQWIERGVFHSQRALELDDDLALAYATLGHLDTETGRYGSAIAAFQYALARDSSYAPAYRGLARAYEKAGRLDDAEATYQQAIQMQRVYWGGYNDLGVFYFNQARYEDAADQFQHVKDLAPLNPRGYRNLGAMYYFFLNRKKEAIEMYEEALKLQPDYATYQNLGSIYYDEGLYASAAGMFKQALLQQNTNYRVWGSLGSAYYWSGQRDEAENAYRQAIVRAEKELEINPRDPGVLSSLATYYAKLNEREHARGLLKQAIALRPTDTEVLFRIGDTYEFLDERDLALAWIEEALKKGYRMASEQTHPGLEDLRTDERFQRLLARYAGDAHEPP